MHEYFCSWPDFPSVPGGISILYFSWLVEERPLCFTVSFPSSLASWFWMSWVFPCSLPSSPFWKFPSYNLDPFKIASYSQLVFLPLPSEVRPPEVRGGGNHFICLSDPVPRKMEAHQSQTMMLCAHTLVPLGHCLSLTHLLTSSWLSSGGVPHSLGGCQGCGWDKLHALGLSLCLLVWCLQHHVHNSSASSLSQGIFFMLRDRLPALHGSQDTMVIMSHSQLPSYGPGKLWFIPSSAAELTYSFHHVGVQFHYFRCTQVEELLHLVTKLSKEVEYLRQGVREKLQTGPPPREACCLPGALGLNMWRESSLTRYSPQIIIYYWFSR